LFAGAGSTGAGFTGAVPAGMDALSRQPRTTSGSTCSNVPTTKGSVTTAQSPLLGSTGTTSAAPLPPSGLPLAGAAESLAASVTPVSACGNNWAKAGTATKPPNARTTPTISTLYIKRPSLYLLYWRLAYHGRSRSSPTTARRPLGLEALL
jgi:hypothetical protein